MKAINRINKYLLDNNISHREFESNIGIGHGFMYYRLKANSDLSETVIKKVSKEYPELTIKFLLFGIK